MNGVELRHLVYFEAVARHGGFTRAAQALHVAQPSVSAQIRHLEKTLGVELLVRTTRRVELTPAGEHLLRRVRRILDELDAARHEMADHADVLVGRVRLGTTPIVGDLPLADILGRYATAYPGVDVELSSGLVGDLLERLARGELDLVIGPEHAPDDRFRSCVVAAEGFVLITGPDDERAITSLRQVAREAFVCLRRDSGLYRLLTDAAADAGFTPRIRCQTHSPHSIRELVSSGMGVALVAESSATGPGVPVRVHRLRDAPQHPHISAFLPAGRTDRAAQALVDLVVGASAVVGGPSGQ